MSTQRKFCYHTATLCCDFSHQNRTLSTFKPVVYKIDFVLPALPLLYLHYFFLATCGWCLLWECWPQLPLLTALFIIILHYFIFCQWQSYYSNGLFTSFHLKYDLYISAQLNSSYIYSAFFEDFNQMYAPIIPTTIFIFLAKPKIQ